MIKNIKKGIMVILFFGVLLLCNNVFAASADFNATPKNVSVGDTVKVTVNVNAAQWDLSVDANGLTYVSGTRRFTELDNAEENLSKSTTVTYKATEVGEFSVKLTGDITDISGKNTEISKDPIKITVKAKETTTDKTTTTNKDTTTTNKDTVTTEKPKEKSNNAYLSTLGVTPKEYDFSGFSKTKTTYSVTVPSTVDSLKILYKTADSNAKVKVSGNSGFEVGSDNKITIKVTAEDGKTTKTYTIKVTKLAEEEEKPGNLIDDEEGLYLTALTLEGVSLSPEFSKDKYSYTGKLNDASVNEIKVNAVANNEKVNVEISGNTNLVEGENTINILLTLSDSTMQTVYQIVVEKEAQATPTTSFSEKNNSSTTDLIGAIKNYIGIAIAVIVLMIVSVIVLIILLKRENKKLNEEDDEDSNNVKEYNVYENDDNEFINNDIIKDNFIESLYNQRNGNTYDKEELTEDEKETLEEISRQTEEIFTEKVEGQTVEYNSNVLYNENPLEERKRRKGRGKHF